MSGWIIATIIVLGLAGFMLIPVGADLRYQEKFSGSIKIGIIPIFRLSKEGKTKKKIPKESSVPKESQKENSIKTIYKQWGIGGFLAFLKELIRIFAVLVKRLGKHPYLKHCEITLRVGAEDPAAVAMRYGEVCAVFYPAVAELVTWCRYRNYYADVRPDYFSKTIQVNCRIELQICLGRLLGAALLAGFSIIKLLLTELVNSLNKKNGKDAKRCLEKTQKA